MNDAVRYEVREGVALVTVVNPPVNALTQPVRAGILQALDVAAADEAVLGVVVRAEGNTFLAGADLGAFKRRVETPSLRDLAKRVEDFAKPVVAAIHGTAQGGGLELALACHLRLAQAGAQLGLPDSIVGVVPSAGGSQRLARLVGAKHALRLLISGRHATAEAARKIGLVDEVVEGDLTDAALDAARSMAASEARLPRSRDRVEGFHNPKAYLDTVKAQRAAHKNDPRLVVPRAIDLVEAALLVPFDVGVEMERAAYEDLVESDQARALRHTFLVERRTVRRDNLQAAARCIVKRVGIVGGGTIGSRVARACLVAGLPVVLLEVDRETSEQVLARLSLELSDDVEQGKLDAIERDRQLARLKVTDDPQELSGLDLVIEAAPEEIEAKRVVFAQLGAITSPGTMLASTTDSLDLDLLAEASGRPGDVFGLRFFSPIHGNRLVEILRPPRAETDLAPAAVRFVRALGKVPVLPGAGAAGITLPVVAAMFAAAEALVMAGSAPAAVDAAMRRYGFVQGPFQIMDAIGLDLALAWSTLGPENRTENGPEPRDDRLLARLFAVGAFGQKAGRGFYRYNEAGNPVGASLEAVAVAAQMRSDKGVSPRKIAEDEIRERIVLAMANAGAKLLDSGAAQQPADVDAALLLGFSFPRWWGGPMEAADLAGPLAVRNRLRGWAAEGDAALWAPAAVFDDLIRTGRTFDDLNA